MRTSIFAIVLLFCLSFANQSEACTGIGGWCALNSSCCSGYCKYFECFHTCVDRQCKNGDIWCINSDNEWDHVDEECTAYGGYDSLAYCEGNWLQYDSYDYEPYCSNTTCKQEAVYSGMQVIDYCDNGCSNGECIECEDECSSGSDGCNNSGSKVWDCDYNSNTGCYEKDWANCALDTECDDGECVLICDDDCDDYGDKQCMSSNMLKTCGNFDSDTCLEWNYESCNCYNDKCQSCQSNCTAGQVGCANNNTQKWNCQFNNTNGCYEKDYTVCPAGKVCSGGSCVSDCLPVQATKACVSGKLVWKNACNVQTSIIEDCDAQPDDCNAAGNVLSNGFCSPQDKDCYYAVETECDCGCLNGSCKTNCYNSCVSEKCHLGGVWCYDSNNSPHHEVDPCDGSQNGSSYSTCKSGDEHVIQNQMQEICQNGTCKPDWNSVTLQIIECGCGCQNNSCVDPCCDNDCEPNEVGCNSPSQKWTCLLIDGCWQKQTYQCGSNKICSDGYCVNDCLPTKDYQTCESDKLVWKNSCDVTTEITDDCTDMQNVCSANYGSVLSNGKCSVAELDCYYANADPCSCGCQAAECVSPCCESNCELNEKECYGFGYRECECDGPCCDWGDVQLCPEDYACFSGECLYQAKPCFIEDAYWEFDGGIVDLAVEGMTLDLVVSLVGDCEASAPHQVDIYIVVKDAPELTTISHLNFMSTGTKTVSWTAWHSGEELEMLVETSIEKNNEDILELDLSVVPQSEIIEVVNMIDSLSQLVCPEDCLDPENGSSAACWDWYEERGLFAFDLVVGNTYDAGTWLLDHASEVVMYVSCYGGSAFLIGGIFIAPLAAVGVELLAVCAGEATFFLLEDTYPKLAYAIALASLVEFGYISVKAIYKLTKFGLRYLSKSDDFARFVHIFYDKGKLKIRRVDDAMVTTSLWSRVIGFVKKYKIINANDFFSAAYDKKHKLLLRKLFKNGHLENALGAVDDYVPSQQGFKGFLVVSEEVEGLGFYQWFKNAEDPEKLYLKLAAKYNVDDLHEVVVISIHEGSLKYVNYGDYQAVIAQAKYLDDSRDLVTALAQHEFLHVKTKNLLVYEMGLPITPEASNSAILELIPDLWGAGHPNSNTGLFGLGEWTANYRKSVKKIVERKVAVGEVLPFEIAQAKLVKDADFLKDIEKTLDSTTFSQYSAVADEMIDDATVILQEMLAKEVDGDLLTLLQKHGVFNCQSCMMGVGDLWSSIKCHEGDVWWFDLDGQPLVIKQPCTQDEYCQDGECVEGEVPVDNPHAVDKNYEVAILQNCDVRALWLVFNVLPSQIKNCSIDFGVDGYEQVACSIEVLKNGAIHIMGFHTYVESNLYQVKASFDVNDVVYQVTKQIELVGCREVYLAIENLQVSGAQEATHMVISFDLYGSDHVPKSDQFIYSFEGLSVDTDINTNLIWRDDHYDMEAFVYLECGSAGKHEVEITVNNNDQIATAKKNFTVASDNKWCSDSSCSTSQSGQATGMILFLLLGGILLGLRNRQRV